MPNHIISLIINGSISQATFRQRLIYSKQTTKITKITLTYFSKFFFFTFTWLFITDNSKKKINLNYLTVNFVSCSKYQVCFKIF